MIIPPGMDERYVYDFSEGTELGRELLGGKGIGSKLVKGALDQVRAAGLKVVANCEFVKGYIGKHPEYADLIQN